MPGHSTRLVDASSLGRLALSVVSGLELRRRDVADGGVQPRRTPPVDPGERGELDVFDPSDTPAARPPAEDALPLDYTTARPRAATMLTA